LQFSLFGFTGFINCFQISGNALRFIKQNFFYRDDSDDFVIRNRFVQLIGLQSVTRTNTHVHRQTDASMIAKIGHKHSKLL